MNLPKLQVRPQSTQTVTMFGGVDRTPKAGLGRWADARNLSSDRLPCFSVRKARAAAAGIDGNSPAYPIVAMVGGDHPVLLDESGTFWCNGNSWEDAIHGGVPDQIMRWSIHVTQTVQASVTIEPLSGSDATWEALGELGVEYNGSTHKWEITENHIRFRCIADSEKYGQQWECDYGSNGGTWTASDPNWYNIYVTADNNIDGLEFEVFLWEGMISGVGRRTLIRSGARVICWEDQIWFNAAKLAAGTFDEDPANGDWGYLWADWRLARDDPDEVTMTLCDIDGNVYNGVVVQDYQPFDQEGYWLDTSTPKPTLRQWDYIQSTWAAVTSTYVKVGPFLYGDGDELRTGDAVTISSDGLSDEAAALLSGSHYLYKVFDDDGLYIVIAGVLSQDSLTETGYVNLERNPPVLDFVVEAQNRLWGCRYDEEANLNEIYASKLGDPGNWEVYQGLSTDSWRASRGTPAPFTGAVALDGYPLFFREESLEKVFPSATGAHQIQTFDLEGVEQGAAESLVIIEDRLYYKSRGGVMVYTGTLPQRISEPLEGMVFRGGSAARHRRKYCLATALEEEDGTTEALVLIYDTVSGIWHIETEPWASNAITWLDDLYYVSAGQLMRMDGRFDSQEVGWSAESHPVTLELPEHRWISYLRIRYKAEPGATMKVYLSYDDGPWQLKHTITRPSLGTDELTIRPRRCDHFQLKLDGTGGVMIYEIGYRMERSQGGH